MSEQGEIQHLHWINSGHGQKQPLMVNLAKFNLHPEIFLFYAYTSKMCITISSHLIFKLTYTDISNSCTALHTLGDTTFHQSIEAS